MIPVNEGGVLIVLFWQKGEVMEIYPLLGRVGTSFQIGDMTAEGRVVWKYLTKIVEFFRT